MKLRSLIVAGTVALCGCALILKSPLPTDTVGQEVATYGTRVIRPGMTQSDVEEILGGAGMREPMVGREMHFRYRYPADVVVSLDSRGLVWDCRTSDTTEIGDAKPTMSETQIGAAIHEGMVPSEVRSILGTPAAAYENEPGLILAVYPQPGIVAVFRDGHMKKWRIHHHYEPTPVDVSEETTDYGTQIIRPGMPKSVVDGMLKDSGQPIHSKSGVTANVYQYDDAGVVIAYNSLSQVVGTSRKQFFNDNWQAVRDLADHIKPGMLPKQVCEVLGPPKCGFNNNCGETSTVVTFPSNGGLVVNYSKGRVQSTGD